MEAFYSFNERFAKIRSQRIKKAVKGIAGAGSTVLSDNADGDKVSRSKSRNRLKKKAPEGRRGKATAAGRPKGEEREASNDEPPLREARKSDRRRRRVDYAEDNTEISDVGALDEAGSELDSASGEVFDHGGGGFCLEENGNEYKAPGPGCNFAVSGGGFCMMEEDDNSRFGEWDSAKLHVLGDPCQNQMKGDDDAMDCEAAAGSFLRAMPSLRRKRRKK